MSAPEKYREVRSLIRLHPPAQSQVIAQLKLNGIAAIAEATMPRNAEYGG
jgi:hypothetical protein